MKVGVASISEQEIGLLSTAVRHANFDAVFEVSNQVNPWACCFWNSARNAFYIEKYMMYLRVYREAQIRRGRSPRIIPLSHWGISRKSIHFIFT